MTATIYAPFAILGVILSALNADRLADVVSLFSEVLR